jgi:hypothetical protein
VPVPVGRSRSSIGVPYYLWVNLALPPSKYPFKVSRF